MEASPKDLPENEDANTCVEMEIDTQTTSYNRRQSGCMIPAASNQDDTSKVQCPHDQISKILIIGASGSGKSTAGNILLGSKHFQVSSKANPFISQTVAAMIGENDREDRHLLVLDTPDICSSDVKNEDKARSELERWLNMCPDPHLILFTIRYSPVDLSDVVRRFTRVKGLCDEDFIRQRLVVLFTFGDKEAPSKEELQNTPHAGLREILDYASHRYVILDPTLEVSEQQKRVDQVLGYLDKLECRDHERDCRRQEKDERNISPHEHSLKLLIIGKTGNGKSTVGNSILNKIVFPVSTGLASSCTKEESRSGCRQGKNITVIETPDVSNLTLEDKAADDEIKKWSEFGPDLILLAIRCDVRYTREEHQIYKQIKRVLGEQFVCPRLAVAFTFGDRLNTNIEDELKSVNPELQEVLNEARQQYVVFNIDDQEENKEKHFSKILDFVSDKGKPKKCAENLLSESTPELSQVDCHHIPKDNTTQASKRQISLFPDEPRHNINVLIVGKTGNGKSTVGNSLLNHSAFCVTRGFASSTTRPETQSARRYGVNITVTDTPDLSNMSVDDKDVDREIHSWRTFQPDVILLAIRCDVRYTPEEFQIYKQIKKGLSDDYLCPRLTVAFTFGERLDRDITEELKDVCIELKQVLKDADNRYLVFREEDDEEIKRKHIIHLMTFVPNLGHNINVLIVGKTGNGKSTVGNSLLNHSAFCVTRGFASATTQPETQSARRYGVNITVTDTPDLSNMSVDDKDVDREIQSWRTFQPDVILLTIRCDVRYTPEELKIYKQIKKGLIDDYLCPRLTVAFTFGERLDRDIRDELKDVCIELQQVLKDAHHRYLVFREEDDEETKRKHILHLKTFVPNLEIEGEIKKILLLGPPKSGKSSGGDAIVGRPVFQAGTETVRTVSYITYVDNTWCQLFDTPGISRPVEKKLRSLLEVTSPGPHAIFYFVRESIATTEDLELFRRFQGFIDENLRKHVKLVAILDMETAPSVPKRVKDTDYISCKMDEEAKGVQTVWLIDSLTLQQKKKLFAEHIKGVLKSL